MLCFLPVPIVLMLVCSLERKLTYQTNLNKSERRHLYELSSWMKTYRWFLEIAWKGDRGGIRNMTFSLERPRGFLFSSRGKYVRRFRNECWLVINFLCRYVYKWKPFVDMISYMNKKAKRDSIYSSQN